MGMLSKVPRWEAGREVNHITTDIYDKIGAWYIGLNDDDERCYGSTMTYLVSVRLHMVHSEMCGNGNGVQ